MKPLERLKNMDELITAQIFHLNRLGL